LRRYLTKISKVEKIPYCGIFFHCYCEEIKKNLVFNDEQWRERTLPREQDAILIEINCDDQITMAYYKG